MKKLLEDVVKETAGIGKSAVKQIAQESIEIPKGAGKEIVSKNIDSSEEPSPIVEAMTQKSTDETIADEGKEKVEGLKRVQRLEEEVRQIRKQREADLLKANEEMVEEKDITAPGSPILPASKRSIGKPASGGVEKPVETRRSKH